MNIIADRFCPTWEYSHDGWRLKLIGWGLPARWFKKTKRERVLFKMGDTIICSHETKAMIDDELRKQKFIDGMRLPTPFIGDTVLVPPKAYEAWKSNPPHAAKEGV